MWDGPIGLAAYIFYLSKYYEFVDTFILVLRKKPVIFLHVYHHAVMPAVRTLLLSYLDRTKLTNSRFA